jgi:DNA helicase-2/ATP-dependent DNA helicase PcrA
MNTSQSDGSIIKIHSSTQSTGAKEHLHTHNEASVTTNQVRIHTQILAGAGSGKTQQIACEVADLLESGVLPRHIVALTFAVDAAAELKDRIATIARQRFGSVHGMAELFVGTIHSYCLWLLQTHLFEYAKYTILSEVQLRLLVTRYNRSSGLTNAPILSGPSAGQYLTRQPEDVRTYLDAITVLRTAEVDWSLVPVEFCSAHDQFLALLDRRRFLDFTGLLAETVRALCNTSDLVCRQMQSQVAETVRHVVVDEAQDSDDLQVRLLRRLADLGATICAVGDDDQAIHGYRGCSNHHILSFGQDFHPVRRITHAQNYRSSEAIVTTARRIIELNPNRFDKPLVASGHQKWERGDLLALTFDDPEAEATWIAQKIKDMLGTPFRDTQDGEIRGLSYSDCAILFRSVKLSAGPFVAALQKAGIPYQMSGMANLFTVAEVRAAVCSFVYLAGQAEVDELQEMWRCADLGLTDEDIAAGLALLDTARVWDQYLNDTPNGEETINLQQVYLCLLDALRVREERVPPTKANAPRGEIVLANLGRFSSVIGDFEKICFHSKPAQRKCREFAWWLRKVAPAHYEEATGGGYGQTDAVRVMTIHAAKGQEWPIVFLPALIDGRFPVRPGTRGRTRWHLIPRAAVRNAARYDTTLEEERRLFYVGMTRAKKYLYSTFAPIPNSRSLNRPSQFFLDYIQSSYVLTHEPARVTSNKLPVRSGRQTPDIVLSYTDLRYYFDCPYSFKLRLVYGFQAPYDTSLGFSKGLHDTVAEVHKRALQGEVVPSSEAPKLVERHLHLPFAPKPNAERMRKAAEEAVGLYLRNQGDNLLKVRHAELPIEIHLSGGITVCGRADLIRSLETDELSIVDFKSRKRSQAEDVSRLQLHAYAAAYEDQTGIRADVVEIYNLDAIEETHGTKQTGISLREVVDETVLQAVRERITKAGEAIRQGNLPRLAAWCSSCDVCDFAATCRDRPKS